MSFYFTDRSCVVDCSYLHEVSLPCQLFILPPRPHAPSQTVVERNAPLRIGPVNRHSQGCVVSNAAKRLPYTLACLENRAKTQQNGTKRAAIVTKHAQTAAERDKTSKEREMPGSKHPSCPTTERFKCCYDLVRTVTLCCVHPVLLRPLRFFIRTVTAVANFLTV